MAAGKSPQAGGDSSPKCSTHSRAAPTALQLETQVFCPEWEKLIDVSAHVGNLAVFRSCV